MDKVAIVFTGGREATIKRKAAALLVKIGRATYADTTPPPAPAPKRPARAAAVPIAETPAPVPDPVVEAEVEAEGAEEEKPKRRRYTRRDLSAEDA